MNVVATDDLGNDSENQNSNNSADSTEVVSVKPKIKIAQKEKTESKDNKESAAKSNRQGNSEHIQYEEDGKLMDMSITDPNSKKEFQSEGKLSSSEDDYESDSNNNEQGTMSDKDHTSVNSENSDDGESGYDSEVEKRKCRKLKCKQARRSMEEKIDTLSSAVWAMQDIIMNKGGMAENEENGAQPVKRWKSVTMAKSKAREGNAAISESNTTIYQNALNKLSNANADKSEVEVVDSEITFRRQPLHDSTSLDDQVDTSDDIIDNDEMTNKFIADCEAEAKRLSIERETVLGLKTPERQGRAGDDIIREAEASKARMFATPGNYQVDNCNASVVHQCYMSMGPM